MKRHKEIQGGSKMMRTSMGAKMLFSKSSPLDMVECITFKTNAGTSQYHRLEPTENRNGAQFAGPSPSKHVGSSHLEFPFGLNIGVEIITWIQDAHVAVTQKGYFQSVKIAVRAQVNSFSRKQLEPGSWDDLTISQGRSAECIPF